MKGKDYCYSDLLSLSLFQPVLFENIVIDVLLTVKEIVIETHPGETKVSVRKWKNLSKIIILMNRSSETSCRVLQLNIFKDCLR